jgi:ribonuclease Y
LVLLGGVAFYFTQKLSAQSKVNNVEAERVLREAQLKASNLIRESELKSQEELFKSRQRLDQEVKERKQEVSQAENRISQKEQNIANKEQMLSQQEMSLREKHENNERQKEKLDALYKEQSLALERVAGLNKEDAKKMFLGRVEQDAKNEAAAILRSIEDQANKTAKQKAKNIVALAIHRTAVDHTLETTTSVVVLPSEDFKGKIIGKEGRNIRAFEQMMGVEVLIDDSPDTVVLSGFNSIRRHIAKLTLEKLVHDGRIHPARIEEAYEKSKAEINEQIKQAGEQAVYDLGITNFPPKLVHLVGRLLFRTSYGQNILRHSVEMAKVAANIATDLGADVSIVKQGALLHDIGKALDQDMEGTHVEIGRRIAEKFGLDAKVVEAIESHHYDTDVSEGAKKYAERSLEAMIVDAADSISGSRPGARKDSFENYVKRLTDIENIANSFAGVDKTYAIQGGREIRVFVRPGEVDDYSAQKMAREVANRLENELKFPGEIRVVVIRETRIVEYAR